LRRQNDLAQSVGAAEIIAVSRELGSDEIGAGCQVGGGEAISHAVDQSAAAQGDAVGLKATLPVASPAVMPLFCTEALK